MDCCDLTAANEAPVWSSSTDAVPSAESHQSSSNLQNQPYRPLGDQWSAQASASLTAVQQPASQQQQPAAGQFPPYRPATSGCQWPSQTASYQPAQPTGFQQPQQHGLPPPAAGNWQQQQWRQGSPNNSSGQYYNSSSNNGRGMRTGSPGGRYSGNYGSSNGFSSSSSNGWCSGAGRGGQGSGYRSGSPGYYNGGGSSSWGGIRQSSPGRGCNRYNNSYNNSRGPSPRPGNGGGPPCWLKQDCWLVPRQGSSDAAAAAAAEDSSSDGSSSKVVYILRGLPGAGKSTRAAQLAAEAEQVASDAALAAVLTGTAAAAAASDVAAAAIHSTDNYFIDADGVYRFNADLLGQNHQRNYEAFCASLAAGVGTVILDNTNLQPWQYEKYVTAAWQRGYRVREEVVGEFTEAAAAVYAARNTHGVPHEKILVMLDQWRRQ